jgi:hypothetical protein
MDIFHWVSLVARGATLDMQMFTFAIFGMCRSLIESHKTMDTVYRILHWSFYWLWQGKWPTQTWEGHEIRNAKAGSDLAGGFFAVIWNFKGDLDYFAKCLGLRHYASNQPCFFCPADCSGGARRWSDFRKGLSQCFRETYSAATWKRLFLNPNLLLTLPGVSILTCSADHMHCKHMGTDQWFFGSVIMLLVYYVMPGQALEGGEGIQRWLRREGGGERARERASRSNFGVAGNT